jgi:hypothetical protein
LLTENAQNDLHIHSQANSQRLETLGSKVPFCPYSRNEKPQNIRRLRNTSVKQVIQDPPLERGQKERPCLRTLHHEADPILPKLRHHMLMLHGCGAAVAPPQQRHHFIHSPKQLRGP